MPDYKNLQIWQKAMDLTMNIYDITDGFPVGELYGLTSQMQRAAVSIPSNIAEGYGRKSDKEFYHFLTISRGSLFELQTQLYIAAGRNYIDEKTVYEIDQKMNELGKMISGLLYRLKTCDNRKGYSGNI